MDRFVKVIEASDDRYLNHCIGGGGLQRKIIHPGSFDKIVSLENLFLAWKEFRRGKRGKADVQIFEFNLEQNIFALHEDLVNGFYQHGLYTQFRINDPKPRLISKATVRDRLLHHAIYRVLYPIFDETFIYDSYSCRNNKGTHKAFTRLVAYSRTVSQNYTQPCFALKMDIRKFFDSVDHNILINLLRGRIADERLMRLLENIIESFLSAGLCTSSALRAPSPQSGEGTLISPSPVGEGWGEGKGMPLGNLTSQLFANIYMDPLDKFVQHQLKAKYYLRYADDFLILANSADELMGYFAEIWRFLRDNLKLELHPSKIILRKLEWGIDFVGYVALPHYATPRHATARRILRDIGRVGDPGRVSAVLNSYLGYLSHAEAKKIENILCEKVSRFYQLNES